MQRHALKVFLQQLVDFRTAQIVNFDIHELVVAWKEENEEKTWPKVARPKQGLGVTAEERC